MVFDIAAKLGEPGLAVLTGVPGAGLTTVLRRVASAFRGPVFTGGGLAILRTTAGLALTRAVRVRLPVQDQALTVEAVRSRVRGGLLLVDDLQWADPLTLAALPLLAEHCRIVVALRTPHPLPAEAEQRLRHAAKAWLPVPPLDDDSAAALVRRTAPSLGPATVAAVTRRAGGIPLALESLARHAAARSGGADDPDNPPGADSLDASRPGLGAFADLHVAHAVAEALADLTRPARTAMAALGLLGRPATRQLLGGGVDELLAADLVTEADGEVAARSPYVAEVAAGILDADERPLLHRRLAELVPAEESARHLAAAGHTQEAYQRAIAAADAAGAVGERADLLLLACGLDGVTPSFEVTTRAAEAALAAGRPRSCLRVLGDASDPDTVVLRAEALLQSGRGADAEREVATVGDAVSDDIVAARDRIRLLSALAQGGEHAGDVAKAVVARHGATPAHSGLRAALAGAVAASRADGWETGLATAAAAAGGAGDSLAARWSAWLLVETLAADGRLAEAANAAQRAAEACAADLAYSWQTRFLTAELWCTALRGESLDAVARRAVDLIDRTLPAMARGYAVAAASLAEADGGLLAASRSRLARHGTRPPSIAALLDWVAGEAAWLDGQPDRAVPDPGHTSPTLLVEGLRHITTRWAAHDGAETDLPAPVQHPLQAVRATLDAWRAVLADPSRAEEFKSAADSWRPMLRREEVRCLLALGVHADNADDAVPPLLEAERLADESGLVVLLGRVRRALRRHAVRRETRGPRAGDDLTDRERDVLRLVAQGEPTRRIAGLLGISRETVETHIRSGMRKLGARTRTEAAARALEVLG
ncbi:MAG: LuxR family transcriptional regulator [Micromonosporaceae bacterium]|nr:LuxR family transcriptional regulator [Micromonosporaceae bacterium]